MSGKLSVIKQLIGLLTLALIVALAGCGGAPSAQAPASPPICDHGPGPCTRTGWSGPPGEHQNRGHLPLSGPQAQTGNDMKAAIELALAIINQDMGDLPFALAPGTGLPNLGGAPIEVIFGDSQAKADIGQSEAERLLNQGVVALYGAYNSAVTKTASSVAERAGIPFVNGASSSPDLTERGYRWFFRTSPTDLDFSRVMFAFLKDFQERQGVTLNGVAFSTRIPTSA